MPALQQEYDYYEYARRRQGTVRNTVPTSGVRKNNNVSSTTKVASKTPATTSVHPKNLKTTTTREITRNATRIATRDNNFISTNKKVSTKKASASKAKAASKKASIDPVVFNKKNTVKKPQEMKLTKPKSSPNAKAIQKQKAKVKEMFRNLVVASLVFGMFFLICYRYSSINESFNELNNLKTDVKNKQTINAQLESNIKQNTDLAYIENYAKYQLGMQKPKESQIQKVSVGKQDKIITPVNIIEEEEESFIEKLAKDIRKILD